MSDDISNDETRIRERIETEAQAESVRVGAAALGIAQDSTPGKIIAAAKAKANRLTAAQYDKLAAWMRAVCVTKEWEQSFASDDPENIAAAASEVLPFRVTPYNADFVRREVLGIRKPAKVKPAVQTTLCPCVDTIAEFRTRFDALEKEKAQLREDAARIASILGAGIQMNVVEMNTLREIKERGT